MNEQTFSLSLFFFFHMERFNERRVKGGRSKGPWRDGERGEESKAVKNKQSLCFLDKGLIM